jgi:hypothetical protein
MTAFAISSENPVSVLDRIVHAARAGDWTRVEQLTTALLDLKIPSEEDGISLYLRALKEALVVTKASRADLAMTAGRLTAAAGFHQAQG